MDIFITHFSQLSMTCLWSCYMLSSVSVWVDALRLTPGVWVEVFIRGTSCSPDILSMCIKFRLMDLSSELSPATDFFVPGLQTCRSPRFVPYTIPSPDPGIHLAEFTLTWVRMSISQGCITSVMCCIDFSPAYLLSNFRIWATSWLGVNTQESCLAASPTITYPLPGDRLTDIALGPKLLVKRHCPRVFGSSE